MKMRLTGVVILFLAATLRAGDTYTNPLDVLVADPFVLNRDGIYYLYGTNDSSHGFECWTSKDLVNWKSRGHVFRREQGDWPRDKFWAPEVFEHKGKFYLHGSAVGKEHSHRLILTVADSPLGPFKIVAAPWFEPKQAVIDSHVFRDQGGQLYLYYVLDCSEQECSEIVVRKLGDDLMPLDDEIRKCLKPSQPWEGTKWNEGPFVVRHGETYFLMYSANGFMDEFYSIGYATAKSPLGPWSKVDFNPVLSKTAAVTGPGHHCVTTSPDGKELFLVYHSHQQPGGKGTWSRQLAIDRMRFIDAAGGPRIEVAGPTSTPQPFPSGATPVIRGRDEEFSGETLDENLWTIFSERRGFWNLKDGRLNLKTLDGDTHEERSDLRNLFLQYAPEGDFTVTVKVHIHPQRNYDQTFLYLWQDHNNYLRVGPVFDEKLMIALAQESKSAFETLATDEYLGDDVELRATRLGRTYRFAASVDGKNWKQIGADVEDDLVDLRVGVGAASPASEKSVDAWVDWVRFSQ